METIVTIVTYNCDYPKNNSYYHKYLCTNCDGPKGGWGHCVCVVCAVCIDDFQFLIGPTLTTRMLKLGPDGSTIYNSMSFQSV